jgi:hypothetical protein
MRLILSTLLLLGGCASHPERCDSHLVAINPPAHAAYGAPSASVRPSALTAAPASAGQPAAAAPPLSSAQSASAVLPAPPR